MFTFKFTIISFLFFAINCLANKVHAQTIASCDGAFLGKKDHIFLVKLNKKKNFYEFFWMDKTNKTSTRVDSLSKKNISAIELICLNPKQTQDHLQALESSEIIHNFLNIKNDQGVICYFTNDTTTKCCTTNKASSALLNAGGWQT